MLALLVEYDCVFDTSAKVFVQKKGRSFPLVSGIAMHEEQRTVTVKLSILQDSHFHDQI